MLAMSGVIGGLVTFVTSSTLSSVSLQRTRDRQYAADAAVEQAIRFVHTDTTTNAFVGSYCSTQSGRQFLTPTPATINNVRIRVDCIGAPVPVLDDLNRVVIQRNVIFLACVVNGTTACTDATAILTAKVNFPTNAAGAVVGSFVQSWSVQ